MNIDDLAAWWLSWNWEVAALPDSSDTVRAGEQSEVVG